MCYILLDLPPQVPLGLQVFPANQVGVCRQRSVLRLDKVPSEAHVCCLLFVSIGARGERGYKGEAGEGVLVRTSESLSSTRESEYFFLKIVFI